MVELIPQSEMTVLRPASQVREVANEAPRLHEIQSVAAAINSAANSGAHSILWSRELSEDVKELLESNGYTVIGNIHSADRSKSYIIQGF